MPGLGITRSARQHAMRLAVLAAAPDDTLGTMHRQELRQAERQGLGYETLCVFKAHTARALAELWQDFCYETVNMGRTAPTFEAWLFGQTIEDRVAYNRKAAIEELLAAYLDLPTEPMFPSDWLLAESDRYLGRG